MSDHSHSVKTTIPQKGGGSMETFSDLLRVIKLNDGLYDIAKIEEAYEVAEKAHKGQMRKSGSPYITHPLAVAMILADLGMDTETLVAALLHDVVEDTEVSLEEIRKEFGDETALLVDGMTKLRNLPFSSREEMQAENVRKMLMAMAKDVRVVIIKLSDRLHNMRTLDYKSPNKQLQTSLETMEVFAPLAHRLGIRTIQEELEDIALQHLDPVGYEEIERLLDLEKPDRKAFLDTIRQKIRDRLDGRFENMLIEARVKSIYGIYRKMFIQGRSFDEIYDIYAVRIIVDTINECYNILGDIHDMFRPIPNRFKDYISTPKPNLYQSLHTTVLDKTAVPFEVQIRTWDMHHTAEFGIAAHWKYKEGIRGKDSLEEKIAWVRQILESQKDSVDSQDLLGLIKTDLSTDEVFAYTPKGDVISLPVGSSVIDFAYAIHSEVGNRMVGAKIDGRIVSLDTKIKTGNIVSILTTNAADHGPSRDWLSIVKASATRNKIRSWFKREKREENIIEGKSSLERELRRYNISLPQEQMQELLNRTTKNQRMNAVDELYAAIGYGGISLSKLMPRIKEMYQKDYRATGEDEMRAQLKKTTNKQKGKSFSGVIVEGLDDCLVKFAKCCNPLPGDDIIGYVTRGFGVSVHKKDCINVEATMYDPNQKERWVECSWAENIKGELFKSTLDIYSADRDSLLLDVTIALNNMHLPVYSLIARETQENTTAIQITIGISSLDQLQSIMANLKKIKGVSTVERATQ